MRTIGRDVWIVVGLVIVGVAGCAEKLNPAQRRAYDAFQDCQRSAPTANLTRLRPDGGLGFESREGDYQAMIRCLTERHGYNFR